MNLQNKSKIDFMDSHLWIESGVFYIEMKLSEFHNFYLAHGIMESTIKNHLIFEAQDPGDIWVMVEFKPKVMAREHTCREINKFLAIAAGIDRTIKFEFDGWGVHLDQYGEILDRWELER